MVIVIDFFYKDGNYKPLFRFWIYLFRKNYPRKEFSFCRFRKDQQSFEWSKFLGSLLDSKTVDFISNYPLMIDTGWSYLVCLTVWFFFFEIVLGMYADHCLARTQDVRFKLKRRGCFDGHKCLVYFEEMTSSNLQHIIYFFFWVKVMVTWRKP